MKIVVGGENQTAGNMVRGAFQQKKVENTEVVIVDSAEALAAAVEGAAVVLIDWEMEPEVGASFVAKAKEKNAQAPVLLLCTKAKGGTTFAGMKAGAAGVINKPLDPDDLIRSVATAVRNEGSKKSTVNVEFINPFIDATRNVFTTMCNIDCKRKKLFLKDDHKMLGDISGVMGLTGAATGSVVISMPGKLACQVVGNMLQMEPEDELSSDVCDGVGEVINMVAGQAKAMLVKTKYHFTISIPSVVKGQGHEISHKKGTPNIVVLFETDLEQDFALQVCLAPTSLEE